MFGDLLAESGAQNHRDIGPDGHKGGDQFFTGHIGPGRPQRLDGLVVNH